MSNTSVIGRWKAVFRLRCCVPRMSSMVRSALTWLYRRADDGALLHVGADDVGRGAVRVDVVGAVLAVVLGDDDQRVGGVAALRHGLDQAADREIVVGLLRLGRVHARQRRAEVAHVVVAHAHHRQAGQVALGRELVELALPLVVAPEIRDSSGRSRGSRRRSATPSDGSSGATCTMPARERVAHRRGDRADAADVVHEEAVVAHASRRPAARRRRCSRPARRRARRRRRGCPCRSAGWRCRRAGPPWPSSSSWSRPARPTASRSATVARFTGTLRFAPSDS